MANLSDSKKREANDLNSKMLSRLSESFQYLQEGRTTTGQICIQIGVVRTILSIYSGYFKSP